MMSQVETCPWLILAKRIFPSTPAPLSSSSQDEEEAVRNVRQLRMRRHAKLQFCLHQLAALEGNAPDEIVVPSSCSWTAIANTTTSLNGTSQAAGGAFEVPSGHMDTSSGVLRSRETAEESERPSKHPRISAVFEHEDAEHPTSALESSEVDELESNDFSLDEEMDTKSDDVSDAALFETALFSFIARQNLNLSDSEILRIDTMADHLEISWLRTMGVSLPTDGCDCDYKGQTPKTSTTRMTRAC